MFLPHALRQMAHPDRMISTKEVRAVLERGEIIEDYPEDQPYPSCLIFGRALSGRPLHIVCAPVLDETLLIVITTYQPDPGRWEADFKQRKRS